MKKKTYDSVVKFINKILEDQESDNRITTILPGLPGSQCNCPISNTIRAALDHPNDEISVITLPDSIQITRRNSGTSTSDSIPTNEDVRKFIEIFDDLFNQQEYGCQSNGKIKMLDPIKLVNKKRKK